MAGPVTTGVCANIHPEMATAANVNNSFFILFFLSLFQISGVFLPLFMALTHH
jgi:hypothetical protein